MNPYHEDSHEERPRTVAVFGVFDMLHPGHIMFLKAARQHGDRLIAVVTRDERAEKEKGRTPYYRLEERLAMLKALRCVDEAVAGDMVGEWTMVSKLSPDVICIGHDQNIDHPKIAEQMASLPVRPEIIRIAAFDRERYSTTALCGELGI